MRMFLIGLAMAAVALIMTFLAMDHIFSANGGAAYYGIVVALGAGSAFFIAIGWGKMASKC